MAPADSLPEIPVLGSTRANLRLELVLADPGGEGAGGEPFVRLDDSGRFARVLLGRIAMGDDTTLQLLALKIQRSSYAAFRPGAANSDLTNPQVERMWLREREDLLRASSPSVVRLFDLGEAAYLHPPVTLCARTRRYLHPLCPRCLGVLGDCRDDDLLVGCGLPTFSGSLVRYLYCPACSARSSRAGEPTVFYTYAPVPEERPKGGAIVRRGSELYRDGLAILTAERSQEERARLDLVFPCHTCQLREECYPSGAEPSGPIPAESRLLPVSYHEFHMLPLEALHLRWDELADLLGGADWKEVRRSAVESAGGEGRDQVLAPLDAAQTSRFPWVYRGDPGGRLGLEVLWLKTLAFAQLCRGVRQFHATCRKPHLNLTPAGIMALIPAAGPDLPSLWSFQVKLHDLGGRQDIAIPGPGTGDPDGSDADAVLLPSPDVEREYVSPLVTSPAAGAEEALRVTIRGAEARGGSLYLTGEAGASKARLRDYRERDIVRVVPHSPAEWLPDAHFWAVIRSAAESSFTFAARIPGVPSIPKTPLSLDGRVAFYRRLSAPCDLYGLGMLLFRILLVNDERDFLAVETAVRRVARHLAESFPGGGAPDGQEVQGQLLYQLGTAADTFSPDAVLHSRDDRRLSKAGLPVGPWLDLVSLGFRLITSIPGFGFCRHHADYPAGRPEAVLDRVISEVDLIKDRLHVELFARPRRNQEISLVCDEIIAEITQKGLGVGGAGSTQRGGSGS